MRPGQVCPGKRGASLPDARPLPARFNEARASLPGKGLGVVSVSHKKGTSFNEARASLPGKVLDTFLG